MKGIFKTEIDCIDELVNNSFKFYTVTNGRKFYINESNKEVAEVFVYSDNSASSLIGNYHA